MSDYIGFENYINQRITASDIEAKLPDKEDFTRFEVMDAMKEVFQDLRNREVSRGVNARRAQNITDYFEKVINPGRTVASELRQETLEVHILTEEGSVRTKTIGEVIDAPRVARRTVLAQAVRQRDEADIILGELWGRPQFEIDKAFEDADINPLIGREAVTAAKERDRLALRAEGQTYNELLRRVNRADEDDLKLVEKELNSKLTAPNLKASITRNVWDRRIVLRPEYKPQKATVERFENLKGLATPAMREETFQKLLNRYQAKVEQAYAPPIKVKRPKTFFEKAQERADLRAQIAEAEITRETAPAAPAVWTPPIEPSPEIKKFMDPRKINKKLLPAFGVDKQLIGPFLAEFDRLDKRRRLTTERWSQFKKRGDEDDTDEE